MRTTSPISKCECGLIAASGGARHQSLKAERGRLSEIQADMLNRLNRLNRAGVIVATVYSLDEFLK
jgi:hypothetical protein